MNSTRFFINQNDAEKNKTKHWLTSHSNALCQPFTNWIDCKNSSWINSLSERFNLKLNIEQCRVFINIKGKFFIEEIFHGNLFSSKKRKIRSFFCFFVANCFMTEEKKVFSEFLDAKKDDALHNARRFFIMKNDRWWKSGDRWCTTDTIQEEIHSHRRHRQCHQTSTIDKSLKEKNFQLLRIVERFSLLFFFAKLCRLFVELYRKEFTTINVIFFQRSTHSFWQTFNSLITILVKDLVSKINMQIFPETTQDLVKLNYIYRCR